MITCAPRSQPAGDLTGRKVRLRAIDPADHQRLIRFDRESTRAPRSAGYQHWAAHRANAAGIGDNSHFAIETLHSRMLVGSMWTVQTDAHARWFGYGIGIGPQHRRCGYASDAIAALLAHMFSECGYRMCEVGIHSRNVASRTLHARLGFHEESRRRDVVRMYLAAPAFAELHPHLTRAGRGRHWRPRRGQHRYPGHLR